MLTALNRLGRGIADSKDITGLTKEDELELIRKVQEHSDSEAFEQLCKGYTKGLSGCLKGFTPSNGVSMDDAWSEILVGFYENIQKYDLDGQQDKRLAYGVKSLKYRLYALGEDSPSGIEVPARTMDRYKALRTKYEGNVIEMFKYSNEDQGLAQSTLLFIHELLTSTSINILEEMDYPSEARPGPGERDYDFIALAFAAIADDPQATDVIWLSFSFDQPEVKRKRTDGDVAEEMGLTRSVVQRIKAGALQRMREVLIGGGPNEAVPTQQVPLAV